MTAAARVSGGRELLVGRKMPFAFAARHLKGLPLLRQGRVALHTGGGILVAIGKQLADKARREGLSMQRRSPCFQLITVASATVVGLERSLDRRPLARGFSLKRQRLSPEIWRQPLGHHREAASQGKKEPDDQKARTRRSHKIACGQHIRTPLEFTPSSGVVTTCPE
ncbi:MAG: hypothetical protein WA733_21045 [Methylocystis sp.]